MKTEPAKRPPPAELWRQAGGDSKKYVALMIEHGWLVKREAGAAPVTELPCGYKLVERGR